MNFEDSQHPAASSAALEFRAVSLSFDEHRLLERISFVVPRGAMRILVGPSNCGKSTILKLAIGLLRPDSGQIFLLGEEISAEPEEKLFSLRDHIGVVLQTDALFAMSVADNVAYRLPHLGWDDETIEGEVRRVLNIVGLDDAYDLMPEELSGGMSRRAAIARALAGSPEVMFYDSPCSGLDPITSRRLMREVLRQRDIEQVSSLYVTQNLDEVRYLCSHLYEVNAAGEGVVRPTRDEFCLTSTQMLMLTDGQIIFDDRDELFWSSQDERIRQYLA
ncbi:MAG TPA: ATP-binding cassette domain-containing protein [Blastocatellia bacterium]|nr:ATP-binding cassette domain-containing protein [Blastocatellia bacterium]